MSDAKKTMVLGYTRTGRPVMRPTHEARALSKVDDWTRGDHTDAARILKEHGERERDPQIADWCIVWSRFHRGTAKTGRSVRSAAETAIRSGSSKPRR